MVCVNGIKAVKNSDRLELTKERNIAITNKTRLKNEIIFLDTRNAANV